MSAIYRNLTPNNGKNGTTKNNAGGTVYTVSDAERLRRFLMLGTAGGTFYASEREITKDNLSFIDDMIARDPEAVVRITREISVSGRAYSNTSAVYVAARFICNCKESDKAVAVRLVSEVCRTFTHLAQFMGFVDSMAGWGQAKMRAVREWYTSKTTDALKYQVIKYGSREGWTHRDALRISHPVGLDDRTVRYIKGELISGSDDILDGAMMMKNATTSDGVLFILGQFPNLPFEVIPTNLRKDPEVWKALFYNGQLRGQALVRNIRNLNNYGAFKDIKFSGDVAMTLADEEMIRKTRLHPMQYLYALGATGVVSTMVPRRQTFYVRPAYDTILSGPVADGLQYGFYTSFQNAHHEAPTVIALDISGSMGAEITFGSDHRNGTGITCAMAAAAMAMVVAKNTPNYKILGFAHSLVDLGISASDSLASAMAKANKYNFGSTDAGAPMEYAIHNGIDVDSFIVITDNETWCNDGAYRFGDYSKGSRPTRLIRKYRNTVGHDASLIVVGMTSTGFTIADPNDPRMLDVVGMDPAVPGIIAEFSKRG